MRTGLTEQEKARRVQAYRVHGSFDRAAEALGDVSATRIREAVYEAERKGETKPFTIPDLPSGDLTIDELLAARRKVFQRKDEGAKARKLIPVKVNLEGPIGILHFGDPHIDDDPRLITPFLSAEEGADYLTYLRKKAQVAGRKRQ